MIGQSLVTVVWMFDHHVEENLGENCSNTRQTFTLNLNMMIILRYCFKKNQGTQRDPMINMQISSSHKIFELVKNEKHIFYDFLKFSKLIKILVTGC